MPSRLQNRVTFAWVPNIKPYAGWHLLPYHTRRPKNTVLLPNSNIRTLAQSIYTNILQPLTKQLLPSLLSIQQYKGGNLYLQIYLYYRLVNLIYHAIPICFRHQGLLHRHYTNLIDLQCLQPTFYKHTGHYWTFYTTSTLQGPLGITT